MTKHYLTEKGMNVMSKLLRGVVIGVLLLQSFVGFYGWGRFFAEKANNEQLRNRLEDVQSTCREYESEIVELYKKLGGN